eukprot:4183455-Prymnesium_polylepis.1
MKPVRRVAAAARVPPCGQRARRRGAWRAVCAGGSAKRFGSWSSQSVYSAGNSGDDDGAGDGVGMVLSATLPVAPTSARTSFSSTGSRCAVAF